MKKLKVIAFLIIAVLCMSTAVVQAETQPTDIIEETQPVESIPADSQPVSSAPADTTDPSGSTDPSGVTQPSDATDPTGETEPVSAVRPTEYSEPSTYSDYVSPAPVYTPADQDFEKKDWENIELNIDDKPAGGSGSFLDIKNNTSKNDENNPMLLILCIVFCFLALSAITFLILYRPEKSKAANGKGVAVRSAEKDSRNKKAARRRTPMNYERKYSDDYNDGY